MSRFLIVLVTAILFTGATVAQSIEEIDLAQIPSIEQQLAKPEILYPALGVSSDEALGIKAASYQGLTDRYGHNIFAQNSEFETLIVQTTNKTHRLTLKSDVFEDTFPLIADLNADGIGEIITIQSSQTKGASIAVYSVASGELTLLAQTPNIGTRNRWMNIAGIADFNNDGVIEIALVDRPHIRGELEFWTFTKGNKFELRTAALGFSNHFIGSSAQDLSAVVKIGGKTLLALPSTDRRAILLVDASGMDVRIAASTELPSKIAENFAIETKDGVTNIGLRLADGSSKAFTIKP